MGTLRQWAAELTQGLGGLGSAGRCWGARWGRGGGWDLQGGPGLGGLVLQGGAGEQGLDLQEGPGGGQGMLVQTFC